MKIDLFSYTDKGSRSRNEDFSEVYQGMGIGKQLVEKMKETYQDYLRIVIVAYNDEVGFYEACGFEKAKDASPMFITALWT